MRDKLLNYWRISQKTIYSEPDTPAFHGKITVDMLERLFLPANIKSTDFILDVGCGQGAFMKEMEKRGFPNVIGITMSDEDVNACLQANLMALKMDMSDLMFEDEELDHIWCRHALEHSPFPYFTLLEFNRVLRMGGKLYVEVPAPDCPRAHEYNDNHYSILPVNMWAALFQRTGFAILQAINYDYEVEANDQSYPERNYCFVLEKQKPVIQV